MTMTRTPFRVCTMILLAGTAIMIAGCQTTTQTASNGQMNHVDKAIERTNQDHAQSKPSLASLEKAYKKNTSDATAAVKYSQGLREENRLSRAAIIIGPFAKDTRNPNAAAMSEYAAVLASLGSYAEAEKFAAKSIAMDDSDAQTHHVLGIALDAQGKHKPAEEKFRKSLDMWQGNPTPVLNNLGLNLAAQGFLDEAAEVLRRALETSPDRTEVERNLRIVDALRESGGRAPSYLAEEDDQKKTAEAASASAPKPATKPVMN